MNAQYILFKLPQAASTQGCEAAIAKKQRKTPITKGIAKFFCLTVYYAQCKSI